MGIRFQCNILNAMVERDMGFPDGSVVSLGFDFWVEKILWKRGSGKGNNNPLQYFCLGNPMDRERET